MTRPTPRSTLSDTHFPSTTLLRSLDDMVVGDNQTARGFDHEPGARRDPRRQCLVGHAEEEAIIRIAQQRVLRIGRRLQHRDVYHSGRNTLDKRCDRQPRSEEHTSELQSLMRISYADFCLKKK